MRHLVRNALALMALLGPVSASAQGVVTTRHLYEQIPSSELLTNIALNGSAGVRTFTFNNPGGRFAQANLAMARIRVAGSDLTMTCTRTNMAGVTSKVQTCVYDANGACVHVDVTWSDASSSTETTSWEITMLGYKSATCVVASTSAGATDKLTVTGDLVSQ